jgi:pimeloyl-ACP methyl ester carboxylesterase
MSSWILLRGLTRESGHWGAFRDHFERALAPARVIALDLPGNGALFQERSPWTVQDMVEHCRAQLAMRSIEPPFHLLALSLGGMVAACWSTLYPQEVVAQVLINTSMRPLNPFWQRLLPANYPTILKLAATRMTVEDVERTVLRMTSNFASEDIVGQWVHLRQAHPVTLPNTLRQLVAAARFRVQPAPPLVPTLVLASERDHLVSVQCSKSLAGRWGAALHVHPLAGHDLPLDDAAWVATQVLAWLRSQQSPHLMSG